MRRLVRTAAVTVAVAAATLPGVAGAAPPWVDAPTYGDRVTGFDLAVTPDGGVTTAWNEAGGAAAFLQRTPAGGGPSAPPIPLGTAQAPALAGPVVAGAGDGSLAAYLQMEPEGKIAVRVASVGPDGAAGPSTTVASGLGSLATADLAFAGDGAGGAIVGWVGESPAGHRVFVRRLRADGTLGPLVQLGAADNSAELTVALLPDGTARVLWLEFGSWELIAARLTADGVLDGTPQPISTDDDLGALEPTLAISAAGAVAAWQEPANHSSRAKRVKIAPLPSTGAVAGAPQEVATVADSDDEGLAVALADDGAATVAWSEIFADRASVGVLRFRRVAADGALGPVAVLTEPAEDFGIDQAPRLVATGGGALRAVWGRYGFDGDLTPLSRAIAADGALGPQSEIARVGYPAAHGRWYPAGVDASGSVTVGWGRPIPDGDGTAIVATATLDGAAPRVDAEIPRSVAAGEPVRFRAVVTDPSGIASVRWAFGDGSGADGAEIVRAYASPGSYEASVTVTDTVGNVAVVRQLVAVAAAPPPPGPPGPPAPPTPPGEDPAPRPPGGGEARRPARKAPAALRFAAVTRRGARVRVAGTISRRASGRVKVVWGQRSGRRTISRTVHATIVRGRFAATLRLPAALASPRERAVVTLSYRGDARTRAATATKRVAGGAPARR